MKSASTTVNELHALYCSMTGFEIELNFTRERIWGEWLAYRRNKPFDENDLRRVIGYIRQGIRKDERREGALKFTNLIGSPDRFEEDLSLALGAIKERTQPQQNPVTKYRPPEEPKPEERVTREEFKDMFSGLKRGRGAVISFK